MKIFPAVDIKDKKCVRLIKGNFDQKKVRKKSEKRVENFREFFKMGIINDYFSSY